jgi:signal peptidase II
VSLARQQPLDMRGWLLGLSALIIGLDRVTKHWVSSHIEEGSGITIIPHVFRLSHVLNAGAAFSMFTDSPHPERTRWMLTAFSILAAVVVCVVLMRVGRRISMTSLSMALVLGGAIGNVWDRLRTGTVIDFLEVHIIHYHWPDFNVADSAIVIGGILLLLDSLRTKDASNTSNAYASPEQSNGFER